MVVVDASLLLLALVLYPLYGIITIKNMLASIWQSITSIFTEEKPKTATTPTPRPNTTTQTESTTQQPKGFFQRLFEPKLSPKLCTVTWPTSIKREMLRGTTKICFVGIVGQNEFKINLNSDYGNAYAGNFNESDISVLISGVVDIPTVTVFKASSDTPSQRTVQFHATKAGIYKVNVRIQSTPVADSPINLSLLPGKVDVKQCSVDSAFVKDSRLRIVCIGHQVIFSVQLRDAYGNLLPDNQCARHGDFHITQNNVRVNTIYPASAVKGLLSVHYLANVDGINTVRLFYQGQPINLQKNKDSIRLYCLHAYAYQKFVPYSKKNDYSFKAKVNDQSIHFNLNAAYLTQTVYYMLLFPKQLSTHELRTLHMSTSTTNDKLLVVSDRSRNITYNLILENHDKRMLVAALIKSFKSKPISQQKLDAYMSNLFSNPHAFTAKDIHRVQRTFANSEASQKLANGWGVYIQKEAVVLLSKLQQSMESGNDGTQKDGLKDFVSDLIKFHTEIRSLETRFGEDELIHKETDKALGKVMTNHITNKKLGTTIPLLTYVADYCDRVLRGRSEKAPMSDSEFDTELSNIASLFKIAIEKDLLQEHCKRHLSRRLLSYGDNDTPLLDERTLLIKLKMELGFTFTSKMESMLKDISTSRELVTAFNKPVTGWLASPSTNEHTISFKPIVLTQGHWPPQAERMKIKAGSRLNIPHDMATSMTRFDKFYREHSGSGRKLTWNMNLGTVVVIARYRSGEYELTMDCYLASVLCLFINNTSLNAKQVAESLNMEEETDAKSILDRVSSTKLKLLSAKDGIYTINDDFTSKAKKLKLVKTSSSGTNLSEKENKEIKEDIIDKDRAFVIEACLIRILKARKQLTHQMLITQVSEQLVTKFVPDVKMIKSRIDSLMEREYIARDANDANVYVYLA